MIQLLLSVKFKFPNSNPVSHNCFYYTSKPECAIPDDNIQIQATCGNKGAQGIIWATALLHHELQQHCCIMSCNSTAAS
jgi:hypothetical protein